MIGISKQAFARLLLVLIVLGQALPLGAKQAQPSVDTPGTMEVILSGTDWKLGSFPMGAGEEQKAYNVDFDENAFKPVAVPAEIQLTLGLEGMDLYRQSKELSLINKKEWWYRKHFTLSRDQEGERIRLVFEGSDYFTTVWLNGQKLGDHEGAYTSFSFDVTSQVKRGADNVLAVKVTCPWLPKEGGLAEYMKGSFCLVWPGMTTFISQPPHALSCSWNQIPANGNAAFTLGLIRDVKLEVSPPVSIADIFVDTQKLNSDGSAAVVISGSVRNQGSTAALRTLEMELRPQNFAGEVIQLPRQILSLHPGINAFSFAASVKDAKLWWTWDLGSPNLYRLAAKLTGKGGNIEDRSETIIGIRTLSRGPDMSYWLNGQHLFLKGVWYPMGNYYLSRNTRQSYETDLRLLRAANANYVVSHTVVEKPAFYDLCDELGLMVMVQMPFNQAGPYFAMEPSSPRREVFLKTALAAGAEEVHDLRNHPSIAVWAPLAESQWSQWAKYYQPIYEGMREMVARLAPGTIYQASYCDFGEEHLWTATAGFHERGDYQEYFDFAPAVVSEYGSDAMSSYENLHKYLSPGEMWSDKNPRKAEWFYLPIDLDAYDYLGPWNTVVGFHSLLAWPHKVVDRDWRSARDMVEASQLYQAFLMQYASDAIRRKKYNPIQDVRWWEYKDIAPGFYGGFIDFDQVPKIAYYAFKHSMAQLAVSFAIKDQIEPQVAGRMLHIPVWVVNDHRFEISLDVHCQVLDLGGREIYAESMQTTVGPDESRTVGVLNWRVPNVAGASVYAVRATARQRGGDLAATTTIYLEAVPKPGASLIEGVPKVDRRCRLLLIGEKKYAESLAAHLRALGAEVDEINEEHLDRFAQLRQPEELHKNYDVIWLGPFEALWKLLDDDMAAGLAQAIHAGVGFVHSGGESSFHGGDSVGACLDFTALADVLPVMVHQGRNDLNLLNSSKDVRVLGYGWTDAGLKEEGIPSFNEVQAKPGSEVIMTFGDWPLLVAGQYGEGRAVAFMGYTPSDSGVKPAWMALYGQMLMAAMGRNPQYRYAADAPADKPLMELLKERPTAEIKASPATIEAVATDRTGGFAVEIENGERFARLVRLRVQWAKSKFQPYAVLYDDNYFDLLPGEKKRVRAEFPTPAAFTGTINGEVIIEGSNVPEIQIPIQVSRHH
jgi:beta-mannosidase